ncbi:MAG: LptF/LptG family permease [Verrucomicrobiota bacterium]|nr:LptF/LptG family permease [Verrucomicrobiota bacterium]
MRTLHQRVTTDFLLIAGVTLGVFTFVLSIGAFLDRAVIDLLARGVQWRPLLVVLFSGIPTILAYSIPISLLTAGLLLFGRLSVDGEITAMKSSGIPIGAVARPLILIAVGMTVICAYLTSEQAPESHYQRRALLADLGRDRIADLIMDGRFIREFPGFTIYIGRKKGANLRDVRIYERLKSGKTREIRAKTGAIESSPESRDLSIRLFNVLIDPLDEKRPGQAVFDEWPVTIPDVKKNRQCLRREEDMTTQNLLRQLARPASKESALSPDDRLGQETRLLVEINKRLALSVGCLAFVCLGIPLGITARRKESSIGAGISLFVVLGFYVCIVIAESLMKYPAARPEWLLWFPVVVSMALGAWLFRRTR